MTASPATINEVDFCSQIASEANSLIRQNPTAYPFREARIEGYGKGAGRGKRKDLRFYGRNGKLVLCGEVKLPGKPEGRSAFAEKLMQDAFSKAENANVQFFFTWNVNEFAIFDRGLWDRPLLERRIRVWHWAEPSPIPRRWPRGQPQLHQDAFPARPLARSGRHRFWPAARLASPRRHFHSDAGKPSGLARPTGQRLYLGTCRQE